MNSTQRLIVLIGTILILLVGLFPPWIAMFNGEREGVLGRWEFYAGNHFLLNPPQPFDEELGKRVFRDFYSGSGDPLYSYRLVVSLTLIRWSTIILVTTGLVLVFGNRKNLDIARSGDDR